MIAFFHYYDHRNDDVWRTIYEFTVKEYNGPIPRVGDFLFMPYPMQEEINEPDAAADGYVVKNVSWEFHWEEMDWWIFISAYVPDDQGD